MRRNAVVVQKPERHREETVLGRIPIMDGRVRGCRSEISQGHLLSSFAKADGRTDDIGLSHAQGLSDAAVTTAFLPRNRAHRDDAARVREMISFLMNAYPRSSWAGSSYHIQQERLSRNNPEKAPEIEDG